MQTVNCTKIKAEERYSQTSTVSDIYRLHPAAVSDCRSHTKPRKAQNYSQTLNPEVNDGETNICEKCWVKY